jgi:hypothetical protein
VIHNDIQNQLQLLVKTSARPLVEVAGSALETPEWMPGQQLPAHVIASLPNGRFQVMVQDQVLDLNLPPNTQPGDTLELTYVSNTPRLTFALLQPAPAQTPIPANSGVMLSDSAKLIGNLLQGQGGSQPVVSRTTTAPPVLNAAPVDTKAFAQELKASVSQSGLFYESHQVQWLSGDRNLDSLRQEPQGQLAPLVQPPKPSGSEGLSIESPLLAALAKRSGGALPEMVAQSSLASSQTVLSDKQAISNSQNYLPVTGSLNAEANKAEVIHPHTVPLVQQQLQALDTRQVTWQGEVWPGQHMHWEIEEELARNQQQEPETVAWHTRLNLQLPSLGEVSAKLAFVNGAIQLDIATGNDASAELMKQQQSVLSDRFAASGLTLSGVAIRNG